MQKILFIEDDVDLSRMYERVFRLNHCDVVISPDGEGGLAALKTMDPLPDIIVLDAVLPKMSGHEVLAAVKAEPRFAEIPIVVLTNTLQEDSREQFLASGADEFMIKMDTTTNEVVTVVLDLIAKGHARKEKIS